MMDVAQSRKLWTDLHTFAETTKAGDAQMCFVVAWLVESERVLGCPSCWWKVTRFIRHWPVEYGDGLLLWSICLHDYVNKELGKQMFYPELTLAPLREKGIIQ